MDSKETSLHPNPPTLRERLLRCAYGTPRSAADPFDPANIRKILVMRRNGIGDMICTLPLLRNIQSAWPKVRIDLFAAPKNACIVENLGLAHQIHLYQRGSFIFRNHYLNLPHVVRPIRNENYDLLIVVKAGFSPLLATIAYATQIPWRLGYVPSRGHPLDFCFNLKIRLPIEREHQIESCLRFLEPLHISRTSCNLDIKLDPPHLEFAQETCHRHHLEIGKFIVFNASAERYESRWTPHGIGETARALRQKHNLPTLLCGLPHDRPFMTESLHRSGGSILEVIEPPTIHHFAALVQSSKFLICGDGGPMHVAASVKTPVFVLFSSTDPQIWKPYGVPFEYIQKGRLVSDLSSTEVLDRMNPWINQQIQAC
jgi:ADP-heptose:LPS heptosyltransferase